MKSAYNPANNSTCTVTKINGTNIICYFTMNGSKLTYYLYGSPAEPVIENVIDLKSVNIN
jgi:hypothetical protein